MTTFLRLGVSVFSVAALTWAASAPVTELSGNYVEARTADVYTGPCFANAEVKLVGNLAVMGWRVGKGAFKGVTLDGLSVVAAVKAASTLGDVTGEPYPVKAVMFVDERASAEQREALKAFAQRMTGDLLADVVRVEPMPIEFKVEQENIHAARVTLTAGTLASIETRAIGSGDHLCSNEEVWYPPLSKTEHAMPAYTMQSGFQGEGLNVRWLSPEKRSAFVATFRLAE